MGKLSPPELCLDAVHHSDNTNVYNCILNVTLVFWCGAVLDYSGETGGSGWSASAPWLS